LSVLYIWLCVTFIRIYFIKFNAIYLIGNFFLISTLVITWVQFDNIFKNLNLNLNVGTLQPAGYEIWWICAVTSHVLQCVWYCGSCLCSKAESAAFFDDCRADKLPIGAAVELLLSRTRRATIFFLTPNIITTRNRSRSCL